MQAGSLLLWCRRHWIFLIIAFALVGVTIQASYDRTQRVRVAYAVLHSNAIWKAWLVQGEKTGVMAPGLEAFVGESRVVKEDPNPEPGDPARTGFRVRAEGMRLAYVFDVDQGALAGRTIYVEFGMEAGKPTYRCFSDETTRKYLPMSCGR